MASMEEQIEQACRDGIIPGAVACAATVDNSFSYSKAFGEFELDSVLRIASCTKLVTSIAVLQLVEKGVIGLDDDVSSILPHLGRQKILVEIRDGEEIYKDRKNPITLRRLITHSAGTSAGFFEQKVFDWHDKRGSRRILTRGTNVETRYLMPLDYEPGTSWAYGAGHDWAGRVIEEITGRKLDDYFAEHIFKPLGITSMDRWPEKDASAAARVCKVYQRDAGTGKLAPTSDWPAPSTAAFGGGGMSGTMPDYLKILRSLLRNDGVLLKPETGVEMFRPTLTPESRDVFSKGMRNGLDEFAPGEWPRECEYDWGLGAVVVLNDSPGWRQAGTLTWGGYPNLAWFVDRKTGLCGIFGTQLLPCGDAEARKMNVLWEREIYKRAGGQ